MLLAIAGRICESRGGLFEVNVASSVGRSYCGKRGVMCHQQVQVLCLVDPLQLGNMGHGVLSWFVLIACLMLLVDDVGGLVRLVVKIGVSRLTRPSSCVAGVQEAAEAAQVVGLQLRVVLPPGSLASVVSS